MLDQFLKLLERFVIAHELIAANSAKRPVQPTKCVGDLTVDVAVTGVETVKKELAKALEEVEKAKEIPVEGEGIVDTKPAEEEKPKRKPRKAKVEEPTPEPEEEKEEKEEVDYKSLRDQIQAIDDAINEGPSDAACDDSDELLEEFTGKKMKIAAIKDEDLAEYLERLTAIKNKYFEEE